MLNLQICAVIIMTKKKLIIIIIINSCDSRDSNPGYMGSKSTKISTIGNLCNFQIKIINIC